MWNYSGRVDVQKKILKYIYIYWRLALELAEMAISLRASRRIQHSVEDHSHDQNKNGSFLEKSGMLVQIQFVTWWRWVGCFEMMEKEELREESKGNRE
ncbi:hypothetical protein D8674_029169 [Pyrus ussuriensis x Pyrus communis]|uniref:Uncharacterized protein n=1 Tax=Pyrus ussuriensis x Pyrus communis TaxID=2448454 RepID=A0A5N5I3C5_9ROSA|nr:hypothetical protein D8674_029169 [Pyrus ussuriensis x Pyrus communis]